nr:glycosyltransferase family 9 protein [Gemmatimonadota bacterium]
RHDPSTRITWVLQPGPASLVRGHPAVDEIVLFNRSRGWRAFGDVRREFARRPFDLVLDLQVYFKASIVTALVRAPVKLGFDRARARDLNWLVTNRRIPPHAPQHVQDQYFEFLHALGVSPEPVEWNLGPWPHERAAQRAFFSRWKRPVAALAIGTTAAAREWVPARWASLCDALWDRHGLHPVLVGGRSVRELETERSIQDAARSPVASALGAGLREMVGVLDGSALVVSLNSAPLHMAVALGRPVIGLMGHLNPRRTGPYRFRDLTVDAYGEPGEDYPVSHEKRPGGMMRIRVEDVLDRVDLWKQRYAAAEQR